MADVMDLPANWLPADSWYAGRTRQLTGVARALRCRSGSRTGLGLDLVLLEASFAQEVARRYRVIIAGGVISRSTYPAIRDQARRWAHRLRRCTTPGGAPPAGLIATTTTRRDGVKPGRA